MDRRCGTDADFLILKLTWQRKFKASMGTNNPITIADAQQRVDDWIRELGVRYFDEQTNLGQLVEEVGELSRIITRAYGEQSWKDGEAPVSIKEALADELSDVLFVVLCLANQTGVDLSEALIANLEKKTKRDHRRHLENEKLAEGGRS